MKVLVAGGAGYLGSLLVPELISHGHEVSVVDLFWFGDHLPDIKKIRKNIEHLSDDDVKGYDAVVFLAGLSNDPMADFSPGMCFHYNLSIPVYLAYLAKKNGVKRYVYGSTCSVYGDSEDHLMSEESPAGAGYPYGLSKYQAEMALMDMADENFSVISFRKGTLSGFSPRLRLDLIVNAMVMNAMHKGGFFVNNPKIYRPVLSVKDAAKAYRIGIEAPASVSGVFNLAHDSYTVGEVGERVLGKLKNSGHSVNMEVFHKAEIRNYRVSTRKAENELGFRAIETIEDMVQSLLDNKAFIEKHGWNADNFQNIRVFKKVLTI